MRRAALRQAVASLNPGYFALVMGTGIVSIGVHTNGLETLSEVLMWLAIGCYAVLVAATAWRAVAFRAELRADFTDPARGFGFFTFVAGTDVLGTRIAATGEHGIAFALLAVGGIGWILLGYVVPWTAVLGREDRPVIAGANGTWFIWVVASQSVAVLAAALEPVSSVRSELALVAVCCWSVGAILYAAAGVFVAARMLMYPLRPKDLTPPYWVAMGATAITVVAGARIVEMADAPMVNATRGLIAGTCVVFWAFGSWLIVPLVAAGVWRHAVHRVPLRYEATVWSIVFPLGMYGVAGQYLGVADHLPAVEWIGRHEMWVALAAWALAFAAMIVHLARTLVWPRPVAAGS
ncbi:tellurite resistance/C4-dicarboxylate transporter family protein [Actinomadura sp. NAK00032]|uniref:tellurite resistance/C4-dicarboxylate transporter family protein n=1 Tax=Actinomadura sp. NAK00032 TaxID=2742128 RepID=UPI00159064D8|nr:tellurite resistance/C4-dicarboxylate transporter family protein [Actinomadura sp. NAK00032]QKW40180.1 tellurite resistance/C4-dicarboxylate transporter family protein [Actinomadura sp. NAK00032]